MKKTFYRTLFLFLAALPLISHAAPEEWRASEKDVIVVGCRESILRDAAAEYLRQNNLRPEELPLHFKERASEGLTHVFTICDCFAEQISSQWTYEYFTTHPSELPAKLQSLMESGVCKIPEK